MQGTSAPSQGTSSELLKSNPPTCRLDRTHRFVTDMQRSYSTQGLRPWPAPPVSSSRSELAEGNVQGRIRAETMQSLVKNCQKKKPRRKKTPNRCPRGLGSPIPWKESSEGTNATRVRGACMEPEGCFGLLHCGPCHGDFNHWRVGAVGTCGHRSKFSFQPLNGVIVGDSMMI